jgi:hypothetical protein
MTISLLLGMTDRQARAVLPLPLKKGERKSHAIAQICWLVVHCCYDEIKRDVKSDATWTLSSSDPYT